MTGVCSMRLLLLGLLAGLAVAESGPTLIPGDALGSDSAMHASIDHDWKTCSAFHGCRGGDRSEKMVSVELAGAGAAGSSAHHAPNASASLAGDACAEAHKCTMNECPCATSESGDANVRRKANKLSEFSLEGDSAHAWDEGVALHAGLLEPPPGSDRNFLYPLAEARCASGTCSADGGGTLGQSRPTIEIAQGEKLHQTGARGFVRAFVDKISTLMTAIQQGPLRSEHEVCAACADQSQKNAAEGAVFTAAVLPLVHKCNVAAAKTISDEMKFGLYDQGDYPDFAAVKAAFESTYDCLGITCADVGSLPATTACNDTNPNGKAWPDIAGYTPGSDVTKHANLDLDQQALVRALEHPDPPPPPTWTQPFEWIGVFDTSGDTTHTWLAQKVDGKYADPTMKLVMIATHTPTAATMESLEGDAAVLIEGNCTDVSSGATLTPTTSGVCYNLMFDSASEDSTFTLNTAGVAGIVFAAEHEPTEFERDTHYLYDSAGADIEPIAQDYDKRYATFGCSFDSESGSLLVSYGEECTDAACGDCAVSATNVPNGACYMAGGHVHYATCDPTGSNVTVEIHQTAGWDCTTDVTGATPDQTHIEPAAGCKVEEHEHEGDGRRLEGDGRRLTDHPTDAPPDWDLAKHYYAVGGYSLSGKAPNGLRTMKGFSTSAESRMYNGCVGCPYKTFSAFYDYYEDFDYADKWVSAALDGTNMAFSSGRHGPNNFATLGDAARIEAVKKGTAYMNVWMYVIREFEDAIDDCENCDNGLSCNEFSDSKHGERRRVVPSARVAGHLRQRRSECVSIP